MAKRLKPWKELSPSYRRRLERAGVTAKDRRAGADLRRARGHTPPPRPGEAPKDLRGRTPTPAEAIARRAWRETTSPAWLPDRERMGDATAAALSQLKSPREWTSVSFKAAPEGQSWTMTVNYRRGYPDVITLPPGSHTEVLELLTNVLTDGNEDYTGDDGEWENYVDDGRDYDVEGS